MGPGCSTSASGRACRRRSGVNWYCKMYSSIGERRLVQALLLHAQRDDHVGVLEGFFNPA